MDLEDLRAVSTAATVPQVLSAYRAGLFPMGIGPGGSGRIGWWAPRQRGVLLPGGLRVSKSLRKSMRHFEFSVDRDFGSVIRACANLDRTGHWITEDIIGLYTALHNEGWAHSIEVWSSGRLVGGLYGVGIGSLFAGESMFHHERDASKAALVYLVELLDSTGHNDQGKECHGDENGEGHDLERQSNWLIDTQWWTPHLSTLGVSEISGLEYSVRLDSAIRGDRCQLILN